MPYEGKEFRILSGSLNITPPGSEIAEHDAQKMDNISYDSAGNLRSRKGHNTICSASNVSQMLKALDSRWQAIDEARITGYQQFLWKVGSGEVDKDCGAIITNSGPRKTTGANDWEWGIRPPTQKATVKAAAVASTLLTDFASGVVDPPGFDGINMGGGTLDGHLVIDNTAGDETFSITIDVSADLKDGHHIDDVHKIVLWCKQWKKVEGVSFEVDVNSGDFTTDAYVCKMPLVNKIIGKRDTAVFYIRARPLGVDQYAQDKKRYGHFERIGSTPDKDWGTVTKLRIKVDFSDSTKFSPFSWKVIGDEDNSLEGDDYQVFYTFVNDYGHESNPSPASDKVTCNRNGIKITGMGTSSDPQVTKKKIYLSGGTLGGIWQVNGSGAEGEADPTTVNGITGSTYDITQSEEDILTLGIEMENDHDLPPDGKVVAGPYYDRILIAQTAAHPERIWWSKQTKPSAFPGSDQAIGSWNDVGMAGEKLMAITLRPHAALLYKENSVHILTGDPGDLTGDFHETSAQMGITSPNGVCKGGAVDYAHMSEGIYRFNGNTPEKISQKVDPIFKNRTTTLSDGTTASPISDVTTSAIGYRDNVVWFSYDASGGRRTLKYDIETGRWTSDTRGFDAFYYEGQNGSFVGALSTGQVVSLEQGFSNVDVDYLSKDYDLGTPDMDKRFEDFTLETLGDPLTVTAYLNGRMPDAATVVLGTTVPGRNVFKLALDSTGRRARTAAIRCHGTVSSETVINKLIFNYYEEAREAKSYDTAVADAGTHKVKLIRELMPDFESDGPVLFTLYTDVPNFALASREGKLIGASSRHMEPIVMTQVHYGHDFQIVGAASGATLFHLFGLKALVQIVGTYLHGSKSEYYISDPLDFNSERIKMVREIEVVYDTTGTVLLSLETDQPGNVLLVRGVSTLPATSGEQSIKIQLNGLIRGRILRLGLYPTGDCRIEAIRFDMKQVGLPQATPWGWTDLPLEKTQDAIWIEIPFGRDRAA